MPAGQHRPEVETSGEFCPAGHCGETGGTPARGTLGTLRLQDGHQSRRATKPKTIPQFVYKALALFSWLSTSFRLPFRHGANLNSLYTEWSPTCKHLKEILANVYRPTVLFPWFVYDLNVALPLAVTAVPIPDLTPQAQAKAAFWCCRQPHSNCFG